MPTQTNITLKLDLIENARISGGRLIRPGFATGIDTSAPQTTLIRFLQVAGMPQKGEAHPGGLGLEVIDYDVRPVGPDQAFILIIYESRGFGGVPVETLGFRDTSTLASEATQLLPVSQGLAQLRFTVDDTDPDPNDHDNPVATINYPGILRNRICSGLFTEPRPATWRKCMKRVNGGKFQDLDKGFWYCSYFDEQWSNADNKYRVTVAFSTKEDEDWSSYYVGKSPDGKFLNVPRGVTDALRAQDYKSGIVYQKNGILKAGMFLAADFNGIFGQFIQGPVVPGKTFNGSGF